MVDVFTKPGSRPDHQPVRLASRLSEAQLTKIRESRNSNFNVGSRRLSGNFRAVAGTAGPIGWEARLPFPSPHTTVRTGPYTAVQESRDRTGI